MSIERGVADRLRKRVRRSSPGVFFKTADLTRDLGSPRAVESALSRLAASDEPLVRVRNGLYWRSPASRYGKARPRPVSVALELRKKGTGPTGWTALRTLGLTTQVPPIEELAVVGAPPTGVDGIRFVKRSNPERRRLTYDEIAALETVRVVERDTPEWAGLVATVRAMASNDRLRISRLSSVAEGEPARVRSAVRDLVASAGSVA